MFIYLDTATPRLMLSLLINVSRQGSMLIAYIGCCVVTFIFSGMGCRETCHASKALLSCERKKMADLSSAI